MQNLVHFYKQNYDNIFRKENHKPIDTFIDKKTIRLNLNIFKKN